MLIKQQRNGRAYLSMSDDLIKRFLPDLEAPVWGAVGLDISTQVQTNLDEVQRKIWLPPPCENYRVVGLFYGVLHQHWYVIYEDLNIPLPLPNTMIPEIIVTYTHDSISDKVHIVSARLQLWT